MYFVPISIFSEGFEHSFAQAQIHYSELHLRHRMIVKHKSISEPNWKRNKVRQIIIWGTVMYLLKMLHVYTVNTSNAERMALVAVLANAKQEQWTLFESGQPRVPMCEDVADTNGSWRCVFTLGMGEPSCYGCPRRKEIRFRGTHRPVNSSHLIRSCASWTLIELCVRCKNRLWFLTWLYHVSGFHFKYMPQFVFCQFYNNVSKL